VADDDCIPQLFCCAIRVAALQANGQPAVGGAMYVSNALQKATLTPIYNAGVEIKEDNACGATFIDVLADPTLVRADLSLDFLTPDPYLHSILLSQGVLLTDAGGGGVGFAYPPVGQVTGNGVSIELFTQRMVDGALSLVHPYAQWALPRVRSLQLGPRDFSNAAQHSIITGQCNENPAWINGPANDFDAESDRIAQWIPCDVIPTATCGDLTVPAS
jgi:hypothetical protein